MTKEQIERVNDLLDIVFTEGCEFQTTSYLTQHSSSWKAFSAAVAQLRDINQSNVAEVVDANKEYNQLVLCVNRSERNSAQIAEITAMREKLIEGEAAVKKDEEINNKLIASLLHHTGFNREQTLQLLETNHPLITAHLKERILGKDESLEQMDEEEKS